MNWKIAAVAALSVGTLGIGGSAFASAPSSSTAGSAPSTGAERTCLIVHDDAWPTWTQGGPDGFSAGDTGGVYMWHDNDGWHIRVTHATDDKSTFAGRIVTTGHLVDVHAIALERNDSLQVGPDGHTVTFRFENYGATSTGSTSTRSAHHRSCSATPAPAIDCLPTGCSSATTRSIRPRIHSESRAPSNAGSTS